MNKPHLPPTDFRKIDFAKLDKELKSWGFISLGIEEIWEKKKVKGEGIKVCVLDTGTPKHKDIDVNGKTMNFTDEDFDEDRNGHSLWVSGTIKAENPVGGLLGIAPHCQLFAGKILTSRGGGEWEWLRRGLDWAYQEGCQVINVSAGGNIDDANRKRIEPLLKKMAGDGVLVVCAAGNEHNIHIYPANSYYTICVGAVNRAIEKALFSNFGPRMLMMAPGVDLIGCWLNNEYRSASGTSMSSPFGTGVLTLAKGLRRSLNLTEAIAWLALTSHDLQKPGWNPDTGFGYLHPKGFLNFTAKEKRLTGAWLVNFAIFVIAYLIGDEEYRNQAGRMLWPKRFLRYW